MSENKIPKIIHYCWFGGKPLPESAIKCINSWKKHMPDYEIKRWDESNYDINKNQYMKEAYQAKKFAFVSDYFRFDTIYHHGGIYLDTDVEIIRPLYDLVERGPFVGIERGTINAFVKLQKSLKKPFLARSFIDPGSIICGPKNFPICGKMLEAYKTRRFFKRGKRSDLTTVVRFFAATIKFNKIEKIDNYAVCDGLYVYPKEYFSPLNWLTRNLKITDNTHTIHWYNGTWLPKWIQKLRIFSTKSSRKKYESFIKNK